MPWGVEDEDEDEIRLRLCCSGFSVVLISLPMNYQSGSWVHGAKKFEDVFVGSFVEAALGLDRRFAAVLQVSGSGGLTFVDKASDKVSDKGPAEAH